MDSRTRLLIVAMGAATTLLPLPVCAQTEAGRIHYQAGAADYESGDYEHALGEFQRAYELSQRPALFYNIALAYQQLGDLEHAVEFLQRFLNEVQDIPNRENLERRLANFQRRIEAQQATSGGGTAAAGDGAAGGDTASGDADTGADTGAAGDAPSTVATSGDDVGTSGHSSSDAASGVGDNGSRDANDEESGAGANVPAIASFVGGSVGLVMAVAFGAVALSQQSDCDSRQGTADACTSGDGSTMDTFALLSDVGTGLAVVGVGLGLVFLLTADDDDHPDRASLRFAPFAGPSAAGVAAQGRF